MDYIKVNELLEKYWDGNTTLEEEQSLHQYFNNEKVAEDLLPFQPLFQFFREEQKTTLGEDFDQKLFAQLELAAPAAKVRSIHWMKNVRRFAAAAAILLTGYFAFQHFEKSTPEKDLFAKYDAQSEQEAYERTKAALLLISNKINKGANQATKGLVEVREATRAVK